MISVAPHKSDLRSLVLDSNTIDPTDLLGALEAEASKPSPDFRTRVLLRDSFIASQNRWGKIELSARLSAPARAAIDPLLAEDLGDRGFASLEHRLMEQTRGTTIEQFFREIATGLHEPCRLVVGDSSSLIQFDVTGPS